MPAQSSLAAALRTIAGEVEDQYGVQVTPVTVGDVSMDVGDTGFGLPKEHFTALLGATREALVNAAKHAGVPTIDVFAEVEPHQVSIFVRDRGTGFDPASVPADRQGLAKSIHARIERRGGTVEVQTAPGRGTEVRIMMPRKDSEGQEEFAAAGVDRAESGDAESASAEGHRSGTAAEAADASRAGDSHSAATTEPRGETADTGSGPGRSR